MFPASSLNDLLGEGVYGFSEREAVYLAAVKFCDDIFDSEWRLAERHSYTPEQVSHIFWWVMNEAWDVYCQVNANLPIAWLSITKKALEWDHVPINFHPWPWRYWSILTWSVIMRPIICHGTSTRRLPMICR